VLHKMATDGTTNKFSGTEQQESKQLLTHCQCELLPETDIIYSEVLVYCWREKVSPVD
jgi:hypothetical protein